MRTPLSIAVVGLSHRGTRLAEIFETLPQADLRCVCDVNPQLRALYVARHAPRAVGCDPMELFDDESLDAVVIATPPETRYGLAAHALAANKHVFVDAPFALSEEEADELVERAASAGRRLLVAHKLLFEPAVAKLKELIDRGRLGEIYYLTGSCVRPSRAPLAEPLAETLAVLLYLVGDQPVEVMARGDAYVSPDNADVLLVFLRFATGITAHAAATRLDPRPLAQASVVGSRGVAVLEEVGAGSALTVYENAARSADDGIPVLGDVVAPRIQHDNPDLVACERFLTSVRSPALAPDNAREAAAVVRVLAAAERSLCHHGRPEPLAAVPPEATVIELPV